MRTNSPMRASDTLVLLSGIALAACTSSNLAGPHADGGLGDAIAPADATSTSDSSASGFKDSGAIGDGAAEASAGDGGCSAGPGGGGQPAIAALPNLAAQYVGTFTAPPTQTNTSETPDGPLLGNGDVGVVVLGTIDATKFILGKNEFWSLSPTGIGATLTVKAMATLSVSIPGMKTASYAMTESIGTGQVTGTFSLNGNTVTTTSWVQATDTTNNLFFTQYTYTGSGSQTVNVSLGVGDAT